MKQLEQVGTGYSYKLDKIVRGICYYTRTVEVPVKSFTDEGRRPPGTIAVVIAKPKRKRKPKLEPNQTPKWNMSPRLHHA